ncbi:hypothetical protein [Lactococcus lactis]|jgi:hypothetical protein|nr:hypothetical protein [Lactococcus lactis]
MKLFKRKPPKMIQARFLYDSSKISTYGKHYSDWQIVSEKQFQSAINTLDGWSSNQFIALGNLVKSRYDIKGFEKREIK